MSSLIWTPAALSSEVRAYRGVAWQIDSVQHRIALLALADTLFDFELLERLLDLPAWTGGSAEPYEQRSSNGPFRTSAMSPFGSRFRRPRQVEGIAYISESEENALFEIGQQRMMFFADSPATPWPNQPMAVMAHALTVDAERSVDLTQSPFTQSEADWIHASDHEACQLLADAAREAQIAVIRYPSRWNRKGAADLAILQHNAVSDPVPSHHRLWHLRLKPDGVVALSAASPSRFVFSKDLFNF